MVDGSESQKEMNNVMYHILNINNVHVYSFITWSFSREIYLQQFDILLSSFNILSSFLEKNVSEFFCFNMLQLYINITINSLMISISTLRIYESCEILVCNVLYRCDYVNLENTCKYHSCWLRFVVVFLLSLQKQRK